jgi:hypothetical protein
VPCWAEEGASSAVHVDEASSAACLCPEICRGMSVMSAAEMESGDVTSAVRASDDRTRSAMSAVSVVSAEVRASDVCRGCAGAVRVSLVACLFHAKTDCERGMRHVIRQKSRGPDLDL